jgi:hypothetical protein
VLRNARLKFPQVSFLGSGKAVFGINNCLKLATSTLLSGKNLISMQYHPSSTVPSVNVPDSRTWGKFFLRERVM